jgi:alcohol dehydrogenase
MRGTALFRAPAIIYGNEASRTIGDYAPEFGRKGLIVTDAYLDSMGILANIKDSLTNAGVDFILFEKVTTEPIIDYVQEGLQVLEDNQCDLIISVGGGSPIDTGKGISILATNKGSMCDFEGINKIQKPGLPHLVIPTTAGTGSEVSQATIITDSGRDVKMLIISPHILPQMAFVDPLLTVQMPQHITASTGLDALTHAIEAYVSLRAHSITDALALHGIRLIAKHLPQAWSDGTNIEARGHMMTAALEAGLAFTNSSVALVHGMARPLGAHFHIPHGIANAALLATVVEFSVLGNPRRYAHIAEAMGEDTRGLSPMDAGYLAAKAVRKLVESLEIPSLGGLGIAEEKFNRIVEQMGKDALAGGSSDNNPRKASLPEIVELYQKAF